MKNFFKAAVVLMTMAMLIPTGHVDVGITSLTCNVFVQDSIPSPEDYMEVVPNIVLEGVDSLDFEVEWHVWAQGTRVDTTTFTMYASGSPSPGLAFPPNAPSSIVTEVHVDPRDLIDEYREDNNEMTITCQVPER